MNTNENINTAPVISDAKTEKTDTAPVVAEVKTKTKVKAKKVKGALNKETTKVLNVIVKNPGLTATKIQKKLRWAFIPTRALGFLRHNKFVIVSKTDKGYTVSVGGTTALAGAPTPKRNRKPSVKKTPAPIVVAEPIVVPAPMVEAAL